METAIDTTNWVKYPFTVDGIDFVSLIDPKGSFYPQLEAMPTQLLNALNESAIREFIGSPANFSLDELQGELDEINLGYSQALITLA
jgi:hypothetical protein